MSDPFEGVDLSGVKIRFWSCPIPHPRKGATVEWSDNGIARCMWPDCDKTSANTTPDSYRPRKTFEFVYALTVEVGAPDEMSALHVMERATRWPRRELGPGRPPAKRYESEYRGFECTATVTRTSQPEMIVPQDNDRWRLLVIVHVLGRGVDVGDAHNGVVLATHWPTDWQSQEPKVERSVLSAALPGSPEYEASIIKFTHLANQQIVPAP